MKNSAIFVISAILVGALAVAAYTMSNKPATAPSEAEATQQSAADALNGTEPAAGAMDQVQETTTEAAPEATPVAETHDSAEAAADAVEATGEAKVEAAKADAEATKDAADAKVDATKDAADAATEAAEEHADEVK